MMFILIQPQTPKGALNNGLSGSDFFVSLHPYNIVQIL